MGLISPVSMWNWHPSIGRFIPSLAKTSQCLIAACGDLGWCSSGQSRYWMFASNSVLSFSGLQLMSVLSGALLCLMAVLPWSSNSQSSLSILSGMHGGSLQVLIT